MRRAAATAGLLASLAACGGEPAPHVQRFGGPTMGSSYEVLFVGDVPLDAVRTEVEAELAAADAAFSAWRPDSELRRCNTNGASTPFAASPYFAEVLQQALELAAATEGAFDPTVGPLVALFREARRRGEAVDAAAWERAKQDAGFRRVAVRDGRVHVDRDGVVLDLDGIAAGACADRIAARLERRGVRAFFVQVTGEVRCRGEKAPGEPWSVGIVDPASDRTGGSGVRRCLDMREGAVSTSACYHKRLVSPGPMPHHVVDPRTGRSPEHAVVSVSVVARTAAVADALSTAFLVLGEAETRRLGPQLASFGLVGVLFLVARDDGSLDEVEITWPR